MKRFHRLALAPLVLGLAATGLAAETPAAQAAPTNCVIEGFTPREVVVGLDPVKTTFKPVLNGCTPTSWSIEAASFGATDKAPTVTIDPASLVNRRDDIVMQVAPATPEQGEKTYLNALTFKARTAFNTKTKAGPEPIKKGKRLTVTTQLIVAVWEMDGYIGYENQVLKVQFRTPGGQYATVKTAKTGEYGLATTTVKATKTGYWRMVFDGNSKSGSAKAVGDRVRVTK